MDVRVEVVLLAPLRGLVADVLRDPDPVADPKHVDGLEQKQLLVSLGGGHVRGEGKTIRLDHMEHMGAAFMGWGKEGTSQSEERAAWRCTLHSESSNTLRCEAYASAA